MSGAAAPELGLAAREFGLAAASLVIPLVRTADRKKAVKRWDRTAVHPTPRFAMLQAAEYNAVVSITHAESATDRAVRTDLLCYGIPLVKVKLVLCQRQELSPPPPGRFWGSCPYNRAVGTRSGPPPSAPPD